jgi:nitroreductase
MVNETVHLIMGRRSIRTYKPDQIEEEKLQIILEAAKFAPNAGARQLWHFTVVQNQVLLDEMAQEIKKIMLNSDNVNQQKKAAQPDYHTFFHAPTVIVVSGAENTKYIETDCAAATENMIIAAESLGLNSCWIGSAEMACSQEKYKKALKIPQGFKPLYAVAFGYNAGCSKVELAPRKENLVTYIR